MKKFAFILMAPAYDPQKHQCRFENGQSVTCIFTVRSFEEAEKKVLELYRDGFGAIELCGAFGKDRAEKLTELTNHEVAIGYVVHEPELDPLFDKFFS